MKVEQLPVDAIRPYWRNPRHNDDAVGVVRASIERYGFQQPIVVDADGVIVVGHTRYRAALSLGYETIPCVRADLDPERAKEYRIADNKSHEHSSWDMSALVSELRQFSDVSALEDFFHDVDVQTLVADRAADSGVGAVTDEQVEREKERTDSRFEAAGSGGTESKVEMTCPHCGGEFLVDKNQVANLRSFTDDST